MNPIRIFYGYKPEFRKEPKKEAAFPENVWQWKTNPIFDLHPQYEKMRLATLEEYLTLSHFGFDLFVQLFDGFYVLNDFYEAMDIEYREDEFSGTMYRKVPAFNEFFIPQISQIKIVDCKNDAKNSRNPVRFKVYFSMGKIEYETLINYELKNKKWTFGTLNDRSKTPPCTFCQSNDCSDLLHRTRFFHSQIIAECFKQILFSPQFSGFIKSESNPFLVRMALKNAFRDLESHSESLFWK